MSQSSAIPHRDVEVLVVEDESRLRELLQRVLQSWGFAVTVARSGEQAAKLLEAAVPDIAILDLNLPGISGMELLRSMRQRLAAIEVIVLTGFATVDAAREALHLGIVEFLTKPCHLGELENAIDRAIRRLQPVPGDDAVPLPSPAEGMTLEEVERQHILAILARNDGNRTATALQLGISRRTLYYKIEGYERQGIEFIKASGRQEQER